MNTAAHIKFAREISLAIGGLSLLIAMLGGLLIYSNWVGKPQYPNPEVKPHFAQIDISSQDLETLKRNWHVLAKNLDDHINFDLATRGYTDRLVTGITWIALVWGLLCGTVFLYVHFIFRQVSKENAL